MVKYLSKTALLFCALAMLVSTVSVRAVIVMFQTRRGDIVELDVQENMRVKEIKDLLAPLISITDYDLYFNGTKLEDRAFFPAVPGLVVRVVQPVVQKPELLGPLPPSPPVPQPPARLEKRFPKKLVEVGVGTAAALAAAGALYSGLKWYQRKSIRRVIKEHELNLADFSPTQKDAMAAAFRASYRVPGAIKKLGMLARKDQFVSHKVPAETMWNIVAEIYYKKSPTPQEIRALKERVGR